MIEIGLDVGSMTVKAVVFEAGKKDIIWKDYTRHNGRQAETLLDMLTRIMEWSRQARPPQSPDGLDKLDDRVAHPRAPVPPCESLPCRIAIT
ncbi:MAG: hypothetical protein LBM77_07390, partial [Spirochaetaceae bacterium]|nr:hypothetical protein [Spirochaetaceae bacterium]